MRLTGLCGGMRGELAVRITLPRCPLLGQMALLLEEFRLSVTPVMCTLIGHVRACTLCDVPDVATCPDVLYRGLWRSLQMGRMPSEANGRA